MGKAYKPNVLGFSKLHIPSHTAGDSICLYRISDRPPQGYIVTYLD